MTSLQADTTVVEAIKLSTRVETITIGGENYLTKPVYLPPPEATSDTLRVHTLQAIITALKTEAAGDDANFIHVLSHRQVNLLSPTFGRHSQSHQYICADCSEVTTATFRFGQFMEPEQFIIGLLSEFVDTPERAALLQLVGNLKAEHVTEASDDGFSQQVTVRKGISKVQETAAPSIVRLAPYRTFRNVPQPESNFLLRFKENGNRPQIALFEADGGQWKLRAIEAIATWLQSELKAANLEVAIIA